MKCGRCGKPLDGKAAFCAYCGAPVAGRKKGLPVSTWIAGAIALASVLALAAVLLLGGASGNAAFCAQKSFATPEDAIGHFTKAVAENDYGAAMEACAVAEYAQGFDFVAYVGRLNVFMPIQMMAPSEYEMYEQMNRTAAAAGLTNQMKLFLYSFFKEDGLDGETVQAGEDDAEDFLETVDPGRLKNLKVLRIDPPAAGLLNSPENVKNFDRQAGIYGAEALTERVVLYELDGQIYSGGFGLMRYGSCWKIFH